MTAPRPITEDGPHRFADRAPLGTRYADEIDGYTLVAYSVDPVDLTAVPLLVADGDVTGGPSGHWYDRATLGSLPLLEPCDVVSVNSPELRLADPDPVKAQAAREALDRRTSPTFQDTHALTRALLTDDLNDAGAETTWLESARAEVQRRREQWRTDRTNG